MQKSHRDVAAFINAASPWLTDHKDESKFRYALKKVLKQCEKLWGDYTDKINEISIDHCATDPKTNIILKDANGGFSYTKDELKKCNQEKKELFESESEVTPFMGKDVPKDLTEVEREAFAGFVLPELAEEAEAPKLAEAPRKAASH